jgi:hypothetical protein
MSHLILSFWSAMEKNNCCFTALAQMTIWSNFAIFLNSAFDFMTTRKHKVRNKKFLIITKLQNVSCDESISGHVTRKAMKWERVCLVSFKITCQYSKTSFSLFFSSPFICHDSFSRADQNETKIKDFLN